MITNNELKDIPKKTVERYVTFSGAMNTDIWDEFIYEDNDIVINTFPKSGTTWMQQIVCQILNNGIQENIRISIKSPWIEGYNMLGLDGKKIVLETYNKQKENKIRRIIKSHGYSNSIVYNKNVKYICVVRNGKDVLMSFWNFYNSLNENVKQKYNIKSSDLLFDNFFSNFIDEKNNKKLNYFEHINSWWKYKDIQNVLFVHYNDLKDDLSNEIKKISKFINFPIKDKETLNIITEHCTFKYMKMNEYLFEPQKDYMTKEQIKQYDEKCIKFINI